MKENNYIQTIHLFSFMTNLTELKELIFTDSQYATLCTFLVNKDYEHFIENYSSIAIDDEVTAFIEFNQLLNTYIHKNVNDYLISELTSWLYNEYDCYYAILDRRSTLKKQLDRNKTDKHFYHFFLENKI